MHAHSHSHHDHDHDHDGRAPDGHAHEDGHGHGHHHGPTDYGRAFAIGILLNSAFVLIEGIYGLISGSMALVADAGHNLSDVLGLLIAWGATIPSILAALANAALLLVAVGAIALETVQRFIEPAPVNSKTMMIVAAIGIVINAGTALLFMGGRKHDINIRGAYLHMAADALVSLGVLAAGLLIMLTGALWIDPATSLVIVIVITIGTWGLLKDAVKMSLHGVPANVDQAKVAAWLREQPGVADVHHLHIWSISTTETALTTHLRMPGGHPGDAFLARLDDAMRRRFRIDHATFQIEVDDGTCEPCA